MDNAVVKEAKNKIVVSEEVADKDVKEWLDRMGLTPKELEDEQTKKSVDKMIAAVMYGQVVIEADTDVVIQRLQYPSGEVRELKFNPDTNIGTINRKMAGAKMDMSMITYQAAAFTGQLNAVIEKLVRGDRKLMQTILGFFM